MTDRRSNLIKSFIQIKSNQIKSNQIKSNQILFSYAETLNNIIHQLILLGEGVDQLIHDLRLKNCYSCSCFRISSPFARKKERKKQRYGINGVVVNGLA